MAEDQAAVTKAIKVIGGHKSQITRAMVTIDRVLQAGNIAENDRATVKSAKLLVEKQVSKIEAQIDDLLGNDHFSEDDLNNLTDYILDKGNMLQRVDELLEVKPAEVFKADTSLLDVTSLGNALSESLIQVQARNLSQADLPTFNGEEAEFIPFMEAFNFLVHDNDNLPEGMKAHHLKRCMTEKGPSGRPNSAHDLLKHISPTADNYLLMREKLEKRFKLGYTSRAVYINKLRNLNTWKPCHSATELRRLQDYVTENLELLKLAGGNDLNESDILLADILAIVPNFLVNDFLKLSENDRSLKRLLQDMDQAVSRMFEKEKLIPKTKPYVNTNNRTNNTTNQASGNTHVKPYHSFQTADKRTCIFCGADHSSYTCIVGTVQERLSTANQLCHNCLFSGHFSSECRYNSYCKCGRGGAHCSALCYRNHQGSPAGQFNNASRGRGSGNRGTQGRPPSRGADRGSASKSNTAIVQPTNQDIVQSALADSECFMEIAVGHINFTAKLTIRI